MLRNREWCTIPKFDFRVILLVTKSFKLSWNYFIKWNIIILYYIILLLYYVIIYLLYYEIYYCYFIILCNF